MLTCGSHLGCVSITAVWSMQRCGCGSDYTQMQYIVSSLSLSLSLSYTIHQTLIAFKTTCILCRGTRPARGGSLLGVEQTPLSESFKPPLWPLTSYSLSAQSIHYKSYLNPTPTLVQCPNSTSVPHKSARRVPG